MARIRSTTPSCVHCFPHIGHVGLMWNARWFEFVDFAAGIIGLDPSGDDGFDVAEWSWPGARRKRRRPRKNGSQAGSEVIRALA